LNSIANEIAPALDSSGPREIAATLAALSGKFVPPGPSGAPTRGRIDCLPTGRNFYSIDPKALPTELSWDVGVKLADAVIEAGSLTWQQAEPIVRAAYLRTDVKPAGTG
jgi:cobaltochelatase CobN